MDNRIQLNKNVLIWAIKNSGRDMEELRNKFNMIDHWLEHKKNPTINQITKLSSFLKVPFGYLLLNEPPIEENVLVEFRTKESKEILIYSRELVDTINDMEIRQEWMKNYLIGLGYEKNKFNNVLDKNTEWEDATKKVRELLDISIDWYKEDKRNQYNFMKRIISEHGILVMQSGIAKNNTHRPLEIEEFRGFCISDEYAPLIFVNAKDSMNGKLFTLIHELVHICLGESSLFNDEKNNIKQSKTEIFCNKVTSEILVPTKQFEDYWNMSKLTKPNEKIKDVALQFPVSNITIARKALDLKYITKDIYEEITNETEEIVKKVKSSSGNALVTIKSRIDNNYLFAISDGLKNGEATYNDIYKLTGLKRNTFSKIINEMEGIK